MHWFDEFFCPSSFHEFFQHRFSRITFTNEILNFQTSDFWKISWNRNGNNQHVPQVLSYWERWYRWRFYQQPISFFTPSTAANWAEKRAGCVILKVKTSAEKIPKINKRCGRIFKTHASVKLQWRETCFDFWHILDAITSSPDVGIFEAKIEESCLTQIQRNVWIGISSTTPPTF